MGSLFVGGAAATLTSSLWVIFTSTHLIELSQQSALHGTDARDIKQADAILEERMREVRMLRLANPNPNTLTLALTLTLTVSSWRASLTISGFTTCAARTWWG